MYANRSRACSSLLTLLLVGTTIFSAHADLRYQFTVKGGSLEPGFGAVQPGTMRSRQVVGWKRAAIAIPPTAGSMTAFHVATRSNLLIVSTKKFTKRIGEFSVLVSGLEAETQISGRRFLVARECGYTYKNQVSSAKATGRVRFKISLNDISTQTTPINPAWATHRFTTRLPRFLCVRLTGTKQIALHALRVGAQTSTPSPDPTNPATPLPGTPTPTATPNGPTSIREFVATPVLANRVNLSWNDLSSGGSYTIWRSTSSADSGFVEIGAVPVGTSTYSDTTVAPEQVYWYRVKRSTSSSFSKADRVKTPPAGGTARYVGPAGVDTGACTDENAPCATFRYVYTRMAGGDTLIVKRGTYIRPLVLGRTGGNLPGIKPPSGLPTRFTRIVAEYDGSVVADGQGVVRPISLDYYASLENFELRGIIFRRQSAGAYLLGVTNAKFIRNGFEDAADGNSMTFILNLCYNVLVEESFAWGSGRNKFFMGSNDPVPSGRIIFRRLIARHDHVNALNEPTSMYAFYGVDGGECQNCISIDGDSSDYWENIYQTSGSFSWVKETAQAVKVRGSIALNVDMPFSLNRRYSDGNVLENSVGWDITEGAYDQSHKVYDHITFGEMGHFGMRASNYDYPAPAPTKMSSVTNSIITRLKGTALLGIGLEDHNVLYGNTDDRGPFGQLPETPVGAHSLTVDPGLKYILSTRGASPAIMGKGSDGKDIGANIIKKLGVPGTMWGEPGWDVETDEDLWPFPFEEIAAKYMKDYTYTTLSGNRGFAARFPQSATPLTDYIWGYLGNPVPPEYQD